MNPKDFSSAQQLVWAHDLLELFVAGPSDKNMILLLAGDAGSGKSRALCHVQELFTAIGAEDALCVTATTHAAVACGPTSTHTIYAALGINTTTLLDERCVSAAERKRFASLYRSRHQNLLNLFDKMKACEKKLLNAASKFIDGHSCTIIDNRCRTCRRIIDEATRDQVPSAFNRPVLIIDEYGILTASDMNKICIAVDFMNWGKAIIVLVGSVSQLCKPGNDHIWTSDRFNEHYLHSLYLWYNHRQADDVLLSDSLSALQHNVISKECVELLNSRCLEKEEQAMDPTFMPNALRIFNDNTKRNLYCNLYNTQIGRDKKMTTLPRNYVTGSESYKNEIRNRYRLVFTSEPVQVIFVGAPIFLLKYNDKCGRGTVEDIVKDKSLGICVTVRLEDGETTAVSRIFLNKPECNGKAAFYPIVQAAAINTFSAQGATYNCDVIYYPPPKRYDYSAIKASAYVACSRVRKSTALHLACNSFAKQVTENANFFTDDRLKFKHLFEMGYNQ